MDTQEKIAVINADKVTTIHFEAPEEFEQSISYEEYQKAFTMTQQIVRSQQTNIGMGEGKGTERRNLEQIYNIITFSGPRGTGKTSMMLSFMEFLKDYCHNLTTGNPKPDPMYNADFNVMFTGLEYIDVSLLNNDEDILGSVLSKMLGKWEDEEKRSRGNRGILQTDGYEYKKRQLYKMFVEVYKCLKNLKNANKLFDDDDEMVIDALYNLSMSRNLKKSFQTLVVRYLEIMKYSRAGQNTENHFLVISIDDLDMNIRNAYRLLEEIRKYLMIPKVLVLMTVNTEQLEKICKEHYYSEFKNQPNMSENFINRSTLEYLDKIMPEHRKVILKSGKEWEFFSKKKLKIERSINSNSNCNYETQGTIKEIIKKDFYIYFEMEFDLTKNTCMDYLIPGTIREFGEWIEKIDDFKNSKSLPSKADKDFNNKERCYQWFWKQKFPKLCKKYMDVEKNDVISHMLSLDEEYRIKYLKMILKQYGSKKNKILIKEDREKYYEKFDHVGRILEMIAVSEDDLNVDRDLINIIKIYLTAVFSENATRNETDKAKDKYLSFYGYSIWENWERRMISPIVEISSGEKFQKYFLGRFKNKGENWRLQLTLTGKTNGINKWPDIVKFFLEPQNYRNIINFQYLLLFFSQFEIEFDGEAKENKTWSIMDKPENDKTVTIEGNKACIFSMSSFVLNCYEGASVIKEFINDVVDEFSTRGKYEKKPNTISPDELKSALSILEKPDEGIKKFYAKILENKEILCLMDIPLLPLNNIEFLINTGKELQKRFGVQNYSGIVEINEIKVRKLISDLVVEYMKAVCSALEMLDKEYVILSNESDKESSLRYFQNFRDNALVKKILNKDQYFMDMLATTIWSGAERIKGIINETEWSDD